MITIYTAPSCTSCKKAKTWLSYHRIPFEERNIIANPLSVEEISRILEKCDDGVEGLISSRNRFVKTLGVDFEDLSLSRAIQIISENPQIMRRPIIMDEKRLHVGYNEEEIRAFLPRTVRILENGGSRLRSAI
ncbi:MULTISPECIES: transcriptional regulator Spx [unclassified Lactococcus]|uniref:transcriptional regulator Spx n=1 Tax=unclassified Lactococcus TaxID=2643510 RepID=UPI0011C71783|nr:MULTISPECIES: transcriptional regulator Spx [unclassified Lactococcus]MQW22435.1 transcriptional regulator Spx [Lactococcus sp. dk101]TXK45464.1 transcriptional regulator Spx [Lactococcus sp. dk310]TXK51797.1 transcriptional regulator Spx [Lactococcus sp. dk322]